MSNNFLRVVGLAVLVAASAVHPLSAQNAEGPKTTLTGSWRVELTLDQSTVRGERLRVDHVSGVVRFGASDPEAESWNGGWYYFGRYAIDLSPFFGTQIANDVSTTVVGGVDSLLETEVEGARAGRDSVILNMIPRISHGGITLEGRISRDGSVIRGSWYQRAYCCGIGGRFMMRRISRKVPEIAPRPVPPPRLPQDRTKMGRFRVRVWDSSAERWASTVYVIHEPDGLVLSGNIHTADSLEGWGPDYWVLPGSWGVELERFRCGGDEWWFPSGIRRDTTIAVEDIVEFTISLPMDSIGAKRSYMNPDGAFCPRDRRYPLR